MTRSPSDYGVSTCDWSRLRYNLLKPTSSSDLFLKRPDVEASHFQNSRSQRDVWITVIMPCTHESVREAVGKDWSRNSNRNSAADCTTPWLLHRPEHSGDLTNTTWFRTASHLLAPIDLVPVSLWCACDMCLRLRTVGFRPFERQCSAARHS